MFPLSNLLATDQIRPGDLITSYYCPQSLKLMFVKEDWGLPVVAPVQGAAATGEGAILVSGAGASRSKTSAAGASAGLAR